MIKPDVHMEIRGLNKLANRLDPNRRAAAIVRGMRQAGRHISGWIKEYRLSGPRPKYLGRVTGNLAGSITAGKVLRHGNSFRMPIGTNITAGGFSYPRLHEYGGKYHPARPFLRPGIENRGNRQETLRLLIDAIKQAQARP